ncbi:MAG: hypothetical protein R3293_11865 [Candidatus Promineifilaceae bacterium]|nr:hypothetical protein [Candidatus Promineifilaceae bacterium]
MPESVEPNVLVNAVLGKITDVLLNGDGQVIPKSDDHFVAFSSPGTPILNEDFNYALEGFGGVVRQNVDEDDLENSVGPKDEEQEPDGPAPDQLMAQDAREKYMRAESFFNIVDLVPDTSGIIDSGRINTWNPETRVSKVYAMALEQSQVVDNEPDEETKRKLERWRGLLKKTVKVTDIVTEEEVEQVQDSDIVKAYNEKMFEYLGAALEYNNLRISALTGSDQEAVHRFATNASLLQMKVRAAMNAWSGAGHKGDVEKLNAAIQSVEDRAFVLLKQRYKEDFSRSILTNPSTGSNFLYSQPASASFARDESGWSEFYFNSGSFASNYKFASDSTAGGGAFAFGPFVAGGSGSVERQEWNNKIDTSRFKMRFKLARSTVARPWFNLDFLLSAFWRFDQNNTIVRNAMISDGERPANGLLPAIITDVIFVRDLELDFGESNSEFERKTKEVSGGGGVAFGPFHIGGRHTSTNDDRTYEAHWSSQGVKINGMQIIGFICYMLPKSPDPHPEITSWI